MHCASRQVVDGVGEVQCLHGGGARVSWVRRQETGWKVS